MRSLKLLFFFSFFNCWIKATVGEIMKIISLIFFFSGSNENCRNGNIKFKMMLIAVGIYDNIVLLLFSVTFLRSECCLYDHFKSLQVKLFHSIQCSRLADYQLG